MRDLPASSRAFSSVFVVVVVVDTCAAGMSGVSVVDDWRGTCSWVVVVVVVEDGVVAVVLPAVGVSAWAAGVVVVVVVAGGS